MSVVMSNPFTQLNGDELSSSDLIIRNAILVKLNTFYSVNQCCRSTPDWHQRLHQLSFKELQRRHTLVFGEPYV